MVIGRTANADEAQWMPGTRAYVYVLCVHVCVSVLMGMGVYLSLCLFTCVYVSVEAGTRAHPSRNITPPLPPLSIHTLAGTDMKLRMGLVQRKGDNQRWKEKLGYISRKQVRVCACLTGGKYVCACACGLCLWKTEANSFHTWGHSKSNHTTPPRQSMNQQPTNRPTDKHTIGHPPRGHANRPLPPPERRSVIRRRPDRVMRDTHGMARRTRLVDHMHTRHKERHLNQPLKQTNREARRCPIEALRRRMGRGAGRGGAQTGG